MTTRPHTRLGQIINQQKSGLPAAPASSGTRLGEILAAGPRGENDVDLGPLGRVRVDLIPVRDSQEVEAESYKAIEALGLMVSTLTADRFELERAYRTLSRAVRDPADRTKEIGTVEEWASLDSDVVAACWQAYGDVRQRLDPAPEAPTELELQNIAAAVARGDRRLVHSYGLVKVTEWAISRAIVHAEELADDARPAAPPTPTTETA